MDTQLRTRGMFTSDEKGERKYLVVLLDEEDEVDTIIFGVTGTRVNTANGYSKTPEGARKQAKDHWF